MFPDMIFTETNQYAANQKGAHAQRTGSPSLHSTIDGGRRAQYGPPDEKPSDRRVRLFLRQDVNRDANSMDALLDQMVAFMEMAKKRAEDVPC
jgi:hypothetical protein